MIDLVIYDQHNAWSPSLNASGRNGQGVGGFEVQMVQIATAVAKAGFSVVAICPVGAPLSEDGVTYVSEGHWMRAGDGRSTPCGTLLTARKSIIPEWIRADRVVTSCVDDPRSNPHDFDHLKGRSTLVHLSQWQRSLYEELGHTGGVVVPSMIDDWVYEYAEATRREREVNRGYGKKGYVCVSAWNKGTHETLRLWKELELPGILSVGSPYGAPSDAYQRCAAAGARWLGQLTPKGIVQALASAEAVFRVCERPETFGVTDAIAEVVGTRVHCLCTNGVGAANEVLLSGAHVNLELFTQWVTTKMPATSQIRLDYRVSTVMPQWLKVLGLEGS